MSAPATAAQIRLATEADADALAVLGRRTFSDAFAESNTADNLLAYLDATYGPALQRRELNDPALSTIIAALGDTLIAFAQLRQGKPSPGIVDPTAIEIQRFYVDQRAHGSGLAQRLMHACLEHARARGANSIFLGVFEANLRAIRFYVKCGFSEVGRQVFRIGDDDQQDLVLARQLNTPDTVTA